LQVDARTFGGIAFATARQLPGKCAEIGRDISPDFLWDGSRPLRDRLAGLRRFFDEPLASRKNLTKLRGRACPCLKIQTSDKRLRRDVKIVAPNFSHFVNATVQIDDAICDVKLNVPPFFVFASAPGTV
jgi:hypothetical protein